MEILAVLAISLAAAGVAIFIVNRFLALFLGETTGESHFRGAELFYPSPSHQEVRGRRYNQSNGSPTQSNRLKIC